MVMIFLRCPECHLNNLYTFNFCPEKLSAKDNLAADLT